MLDPDVMAHLSEELRSADPWRLETNQFEHARYETMLSMIVGSAPYERALEVGCAGGVFTQQLLAACRRLSVLDILPAALARTRLRLAGSGGIHWLVGDIAEHRCKDHYDLVVLAEVLYYFTDRHRFAAAVGNVVDLLQPGGLLLFSSARDALSARWGLGAGAETTMDALNAHLVLVQREALRGATADQDCVIAAYRRP